MKSSLPPALKLIRLLGVQFLFFHDVLLTYEYADIENMHICMYLPHMASTRGHKSMLNTSD